MFFKLKNLAIENNTTKDGAYYFPSLLRNLFKSSFFFDKIRKQ